MVDGAQRTVRLEVVDDEVLELQQHLGLDVGSDRGRSVLHETGHRAAFRAPEPRVRELVDAEVDEHERRDRECEREAREDEVPPRALEQGGVVLRPVERRAPRDLVHVAEPEELEPGGEDDREVEDEQEAGGDPADHVRHDLAEDDPPRPFAGDLRRLDEVAVPSESAWLRRMRASTAHVVRPRISTIGTGPRVGRNE